MPNTATQRHPRPTVAIPPPPLYLRVGEVARRYGLSVATIWAYASRGLMPKPVYLTARTTRWRAADLDAWDKKMVPGKRAPLPDDIHAAAHGQ